MLLQKIEVIRRKNNTINEKTGGYFNIFSIMNLSTDEVSICRVLYELLSPKGCHYQGCKYLKLFFEDVLQLPVTDQELLSASVYREYRINADRRIDLMIKTINYHIPIEVKIYAQDQKKQCYDYYQEAKNSNVYYLTRFGQKPSEESAEGLHNIEDGYREVTTISFQTDILQWLVHCMSLKDTIKIAPIREVLLQLYTTIQSFTGQMEDDLKMEIVDLIMQSQENMINAMHMQDAIKEAKITMLKKFFQAVENKVSIQKLRNEYDYEANDYKSIKGFYDHKYSTNPGISYMCKKNVKSEVDIWVRIEIDYNLFMGYCCPDNGHSTKQPLTKEEIKKLINKDVESGNDWWAWWTYYCIDQEQECINFKELNGAYLKLYDKEYFDYVTTDCANKINALIVMK